MRITDIFIERNFRLYCGETFKFYDDIIIPTMPRYQFLKKGNFFHLGLPIKFDLLMN